MSVSSALKGEARKIFPDAHSRNDVTLRLPPRMRCTGIRIFCVSLGAIRPTRVQAAACGDCGTRAVEGDEKFGVVTEVTSSSKARWLRYGACSVVAFGDQAIVCNMNISSIEGTWRSLHEPVQIARAETMCQKTMRRGRLAAKHLVMGHWKRLIMERKIVTVQTVFRYKPRLLGDWL